MIKDREAVIALDAFGTDRRPDPEVTAALSAASSGLMLELIGDQGTLEAKIARLGAQAQDGESSRAIPAGGSGLWAAGSPTDRIEIVHAPAQIAMDASPARAVRGAPDSSLCVAIDRLAEGRVDAVVSAGNSGAILAASLLRLGRLVGVDRPAIATSFPWADDRSGRGHTVLLDAGANTDCKILNLVQFAVIGAAYSQIEAGVERPRVAILANGSESAKGTALTRGTHETLSRAQLGPSALFEFVGYIEPNELFTAACDVVVTDGWTGNVALKLAEGAMAAWPRMLRLTLAALDTSPARDTQGENTIADAIEMALRSVSQRVDPEAHGGAPLLGVDGAVMICHGAAGPRAIHNALVTAQCFAERGLSAAIGEAIEQHSELFELARNLR